MELLIRCEDLTEVNEMKHQLEKAAKFLGDVQRIGVELTPVHIYMKWPEPVKKEK